MSLIVKDCPRWEPQPQTSSLEFTSYACPFAKFDLLPYPNSSFCFVPRHPTLLPQVLSFAECSSSPDWPSSLSCETCPIMPYSQLDNLWDHFSFLPFPPRFRVYFSMHFHSSKIDSVWNSHEWGTIQLIRNSISFFLMVHLLPTYSTDPLHYFQAAIFDFDKTHL